MVRAETVTGLAISTVRTLQSDRVHACLFGGAAIVLVADWIGTIGRERPLKDFDVVVARQDHTTAIKNLSAIGWRADPGSLLLGDRQKVIFKRSATELLDLYVEPLRFNHTIRVSHVMHLGELVLPWPQLLLSKLQIVRPSKNDLDDVIALMDVPGDVNQPGSRWSAILEECSMSWGLYTTTNANLERVVDRIGQLATLEKRATVLKAVIELRTELEMAPKAFPWRLRRLLGRRLKWYADVDD